MAFTMTHLIVAENVSEIFGDHALLLPQYYLGSIAPDAVHNRENYISDYKKKSHLITDDAKWGMITNNDRWRANVASFLKNHKDSEHYDFILGYCCHILTDLYNNINVWTPYRLSNSVDIESINDSIHHRENNKIDIELALTHESRSDFWLNLTKSRSIELPPIIYATEIDAQKDKILNSWYKDKDRQDVSKNTIRTFEGEMDFIVNATDYVVKFFHENLC
jgi:hypothetical protein